MANGYEAPSDDPYCAEHGKRFDPARGCPECVQVQRAGVLWQPCPTCGAEPGEACMRLATGETFHDSRPDGYED